ncbi:precorrin-3B synthase [Actinoplanes sp. NPDC051411]|uniref:precorrin-3B synthase n=1 Tax=Actinoplanes sp. NPDC051411 TaxID=3155522 RepID=UPI0034278039
MPARRQTADDACPGALRLHAAADGALARIRLPGGMLTGRRLRVLTEIAEEQGDGALELTSRANIQLRALRADPTELAGRLAAAGLLPSLAHETVRNIAAPPLADAETRRLVEELDRGLCADDALAALPGRFLFAIGRTSLAADVTAIPLADHPADPHAPADTAIPPADPHAPADTAIPPADPHGPADTAIPLADHPADPHAPADTAIPLADAHGPAGAASGRWMWVIVLGGTDVGLRVAADQVVATMLAAAHGFLAERAGREPKPWRLREVPDGPELIASRLRNVPGGAEPVASRLRKVAGGAEPVASRLRKVAGGAGAEQPGAGLEPAGGTAPAAAEPAAEGPRQTRTVAGQLPDKSDPRRLPETAGASARAVDRRPVITEPEAEPLVGRLAGGAVGALVPFGRLTGVHLRVLARAERLAVTPSGGVVILDLAPEEAELWVRDLTQAGLVTESDSKWVGITTCAGRPGCGKALADVRGDAERAARFVAGLPVHWVGCERGCGSPATPHVRVEATGGGYLVDGEPVEGDLGEVVAARRA